MPCWESKILDEDIFFRKFGQDFDGSLSDWFFVLYVFYGFAGKLPVKKSRLRMKKSKLDFFMRSLETSLRNPFLTLKNSLFIMSESFFGKEICIFLAKRAGFVLSRWLWNVICEDFSVSSLPSFFLVWHFSETLFWGKKSLQKVRSG